MPATQEPARRARLCPKGHGSFAYPAQLCPSCDTELIIDRQGEVLPTGERLSEVLGVGGMQSTVWTAIRPDGAEVAVKIGSFADHSEAVRFLRAGELAAAVSHPHVASVYGSGRLDAKALFVVMPKLVGNSLQHILHHRAAPWRFAVLVTDQLLQALDAIHRAGIIHRDVKPGNIHMSKVDGRWHAQLIDFGIAKRFDGPIALDDDDVIAVQHKRIRGTPAYMAPELIVGGALDSRVDLYAAGVTLFRMLAGRLPFRGRNRFEIYQGHLGTEPPRLDTSRFPEGLAAIARRAMRKRRVDRYDTAEEMRRDLATVIRALT